MAGRKEYELLFKLQAALGGNFNTVFQSALNTTKQMQNSLTKLNSITGKIDAYKKQEAALESNRQKLERLTAEHDKLQREMSETAAPSEELRQKMAKNEKQIAATTAKIETQEKKLGALKSELSTAGVNTSRLSEENERLSKTYDKVKKSQEDLAKVNAALEKNAAAISATKRQIATVAGAAVALGAAIYAGPVKASMDFESAMSDVSKVVDGLKDSKTGKLTQEYYKMRDAILDLSTKIPLTAKELTQIAASAGQAGIARNEIVKFSEDAAKMGVAFDVSADQAGDWMAKWRTSFSMSQQEVVSLADKINYLSNNSASTASEISNIVSKIGPLGEVAGLSSGAISALGATLVAVGVNDDVAATGIKKVMTTMTAGTAVTKRQKAVLDKMGYSATDLAKRMQTDAQGAILDFMAAVKKLPKAEQAAALKNYFGEESVAAITPMLSRLDLLKKSFDRVGDSSLYAGSMEAEYAARAETTANQIQLAKNSLSKLSISLGNAFLPLVGDGAEKLSDLVIKLSDFIDKNPELVRTVAKVTAGLLAFKVATLTVRLGIQETYRDVKLVQKFFALFKTKTALASVESIGFGSKIKGVAKSVAGYFGGIGSAAGGVGQAFGGMFSGTKIGGLFSKVGGAAGGVFSKLFSGMGGVATRAFTGVAGTITNILGKAGTAVAAGPLGKIGSVIGKGFGKIGTLIAPLQKLGGAILGPFSGILGKVLPVVGVISLIVAAVQILRDNLDKVREVVGRVFGDAGLVIFDKVVAAITNIGDTIRNVFTDGNLGGARQFLINLFGEEATGVIDGAITILQTVWNILSGFIEFVNTYVRPIVEQIFSFIVGTVLPQIAQAFAEWAPTIASILQGLAEVVSTIATAIMAVIQFLMPTIQSIIGVALETIKGVVSGALTAIKGLVDVFAGIFTGDWTRVWEGVKSIFSGVWNSLKSIASGVLNGIISLVNGAISGLNKLKIPDWVPGIGGKGINIPLIPQFATGTDSTPDTFIAGEQGAELITNAKNRSVFTAAQTGSIFRNLADTVNAIRTAGAAPYQLAYAGAPSVAAPTLNAGDGRTSVVIHSAPVFHVGNDAQAQDIEEMLRRHDEELLDEIDERERQRQDDERRRNYD